MAPLTRPALGVAVVLLTMAGCQSKPPSSTAPASPSAASSVFSADVLLSTFKTLGERQCLPADFDASAGKNNAGLCAKMVTTERQCDGAPVLASFYNCFATSMGRFDPNATSFDLAALEAAMLSYSNDQQWRDVELELMADCKRATPPQLQARQHAVYSYLCIKWSLFSECDGQQEAKGALDEAGARRRALALAGDCPLSLNTVVASLGIVSRGTKQQCSRDRYTGDDAALLLGSEVSRFVCLLQQFSDADGNLVVPSLVTAIQRGAASLASSRQMIAMVNDCNTNESPRSTEEFVTCWAGRGALSCAQQEAGQVAKIFPETCAISV